MCLHSDNYDWLDGWKEHEPAEAAVDNVDDDIPDNIALIPDFNTSLSINKKTLQRS